MIETLPQETIDAILGHLYDDRASLKFCSMASSMFTAATRRHLFSEVLLDCSNTYSFLKLLEAPWCTIPPAMARLVIREKRVKNLPILPPETYCIQDDSRLISQLQGLHLIKFQDISLEKIPPRLWSLIHKLNVREVEVHQMSLDTAAFFRYICTLPALEAISITKSYIQVAAPDLASLRPQLPLRIPFLDVSNLSRGVLDWFLAQVPVPFVHTFRIKLGCNAEDAVMLRHFTEAIGRSVHTLQVTLPSDLQAHYQTLGAIDFSSFSHVRSVHFESYLRPGEQAESRRSEDFMRIAFTEISSTTLEKVSLKVSLTIDEEMLYFGFPDHVLLDIFSWGTAPGVLANVRGHALRDFQLSIRGLPPYQRPYVEQTLRNGPFAYLASKGILSVKFL